MSEQHDWTLGLPKLWVQAHRNAYGNGIEVILTAGFNPRYLESDQTIRFTIEREALADPRMELGACWRLAPGLRPPSHAEELRAARHALAEVGGGHEDIAKLSQEMQDLLYEDDGRPIREEAVPASEAVMS